MKTEYRYLIYAFVFFHFSFLVPGEVANTEETTSSQQLVVENSGDNKKHSTLNTVDETANLQVQVDVVKLKDNAQNSHLTNPDETKAPQSDIKTIIDKEGSTSTSSTEKKTTLETDTEDVLKNEGSAPVDSSLSGLFRKPTNEKCNKQGDKNCDGGISDDIRPITTASGEFIGPKFQRIHLVLPRRQLNEVGHVEEVEINGRVMNVKLLSQVPLVFEISNFLSANETDLIIDMAEGSIKGKHMSDVKATVVPVTLNEGINQVTFDEWDDDYDGKVSLKELHEIPEMESLMLSENDMKEVVVATKADKDADGFLTYSEFKDGGMAAMREYLTAREEKRSQFKVQGVKETWLWHDEDELLSYENLLEDYHDRIKVVTGIPIQLIEQTEPLQVQKKESGSFTPCQYDSSTIRGDTKCCVFGGVDCRRCRYVSVHIFLNDVGTGGDLVFPLADEEEILSSKIMKEQLIEKCESVPNRNLSNLVIPAKRGTAVLWYNHGIAKHTGWIDQLEPQSVVGMTTVGDEPQWTAKMWVDIIGDGIRELRPWRLGTNWLSENNKHDKLIEDLRNDYFLESETYVHQTRKKYRRDGEDDDDNAVIPTDMFVKSRRVSKRTTKNKQANVKQDSILNQKIQFKLATGKDQKSSDELKDMGEPIKPIAPSLPGLHTVNLKDEEEALRNILTRAIVSSKPDIPGTPTASTIENRYVQAAMLLLQELGRDELEIVARTLYEKLQVNCIPLIVNPLAVNR